MFETNTLKKPSAKSLEKRMYLFINLFIYNYFYSLLFKINYTPIAYEINEQTSFFTAIPFSIF